MVSCRFSLQPTQISIPMILPLSELLRTIDAKNWKHWQRADDLQVQLKSIGWRQQGNGLRSTSKSAWEILGGQTPSLSTASSCFFKNAESTNRIFENDPADYAVVLVDFDVYLSQWQKRNMESTQLGPMAAESKLQDDFMVPSIQSLKVFVANISGIRDAF